MSRDRIKEKVRKNWCFQEATRLLESLDLKFSVHKPTGKGHPFLLITHPTGGEAIRMHIACTPRSRSTGRSTIATLRHKLADAGILVK